MNSTHCKRGLLFFIIFSLSNIFLYGTNSEESLPIKKVTKDNENNKEPVSRIASIRGRVYEFLKKNAIMLITSIVTWQLTRYARNYVKEKIFKMCLDHYPWMIVFYGIYSVLKKDDKSIF